MELNKGTAETRPANGATKVPDPEVDARPKRRHFSAEFKMRILQAVDACKEPGAIGVILRQEALYSSHLSAWRREREEGALSALSKKRGRRSMRNPLVEENERLQRENSKLQQRLEQAEAIIEIQKKISEILGIPLRSPKNAESDS